MFMRGFEVTKPPKMYISLPTSVAVCSLWCVDVYTLRIAMDTTVAHLYAQKHVHI
jgi:hypothetical protein